MDNMVRKFACAAMLATGLGGVSAVHAATYDLANVSRGAYTSTRAHATGGSGTAGGVFFTGLYNNIEYRSFTVFDLSAVKGDVVSATLTFDSTKALAAGTPGALFSLFDFTGSVSNLVNGLGDVSSTFDDLGTGTSFGSFSPPSKGTVSVKLNLEALKALTAAAGGRFAIGGTASSGTAFGGTYNTAATRLSVETTDVTASVPEPATWTMMLLGFGGAGFALRRRQRTATKLVSVAA